jgi:hypothetical protein
MQNRKLLFYLLVFGVMMIIGYQIGTSVTWEQITLEGTSTADASLEHQTHLLIGVDRIEGQYQQLQSLWWVHYSRDRSVITLTPIFPDPSSPTRNQILAGSFSLNSEGKPSAGFINTLASLGFNRPGEILIDKAGASLMIDFFGGVNLHDQIMAGETAIEGIPSWIDNPETAISCQQELIQAICDSISQNWAINIPSSLMFFEELMNHHISTNLEVNQITEDWIRFANYGNQLQCEFAPVGPSAVVTSESPP